MWYARSRWRLTNVPVPCLLPYGGWFLAYGDGLGAQVAGYRLAGHPYEEPYWKIVRRLLSKGDVFLDVGANQGFFTILASRSVGSSGRVLAFEPAWTEALKLRRNLKLNRCRNVTIHECALGNADGSATFNLVLDHQGSFSSLRQPASDVVARSVQVSVPIRRLDFLVEEHGVDKLTLLKIDAEGGELDVLQGGMETLRTLRPIVICETSDLRTRPWGYAAIEIVRLLETLGYQPFQVMDGTGRLQRLGTRPLPQNLVSVPSEMVATIEALIEAT